MGRKERGFIALPANIFKDRRLNALDISLLSIFFFLLKKEKGTLQLDVDALIDRLDISRNQFKLSLERLERFGWVRVKDFERIMASSMELDIDIPELIDDPYNQPGSMIAKSWNKYFGNRLIKYEEVQELKRFVLDGMEEELVLKVMEYSGLRAENPFHYTKAILLDLYSRGILTLEDYNKEKRKGEAGHGQYFSEDDRRKKEEVERKRARFKADEYR
mgnify:CR=1 FL=1